MITFTFDAEAGKSFIEVKTQNDEITNPATMIKLEATDNETIKKTCQEWLDAFGLSEKEYRINVQLH